MRAMIRNLFISEIHYDTRRPPTPEEFTMAMKVEVNRLRLELLLSQPPPPQYDLPPRRSPARPPPVSPPCSSPLTCAQPESSGNDQIESDFLKVMAVGQEEERRETLLVVRPDDTIGKHRERREIMLVQVQILGEEGKVVPKRECPALESTSAGTGLERPGKLS